MIRLSLVLLLESSDAFAKPADDDEMDDDADGSSRPCPAGVSPDEGASNESWPHSKPPHLTKTVRCDGHSLEVLIET